MCCCKTVVAISTGRERAAVTAGELRIVCNCAPAAPPEEYENEVRHE